MGYGPNPMTPGMPPQQYQNINPYYNGNNQLPYNQNEIESRFAKIERQLNRLEHRINKLEVSSNISNDDFNPDNNTNMYML